MVSQIEEKLINEKYIIVNTNKRSQSPREN